MVLVLLARLLLCGMSCQQASCCSSTSMRPLSGANSCIIPYWVTQSDKQTILFQVGNNFAAYYSLKYCSFLQYTVRIGAIFEGLNMACTFLLVANFSLLCELLYVNYICELTDHCDCWYLILVRVPRIK